MIKKIKHELSFYWPNHPTRSTKLFYAQLIKKGDLCFDIGANVGDRTETFCRLGASKVVCVEPEPTCVANLKERFKKNGCVHIIDKAIGEAEGSAELLISSGKEYASTLSPKMTTDSYAAKSGLYEWQKKKEVAVTTLDSLIKIFGLPSFCKIDVEGYEQKVLRGLSHSIPLISFEFHMEFLSEVEACIKRLTEIGAYKYNFMMGEPSIKKDFVFKNWVTQSQLMEAIKSTKVKDLLYDSYGDVYAKHIRSDI